MFAKQRGFNLIELMLIWGITVIIAAVAIPAYSNYTNKERFKEVILEASVAKFAIKVCSADASCLSKGKINLESSKERPVPTIPCIGAGGGLWGEGADNNGNLCLSQPGRKALSVSYTEEGVITVTANAGYFGGTEGQPDATYVLTPKVDEKGNIEWDRSGSCKTRAGGAIC